jgi:hypothetical protein
MFVDLAPRNPGPTCARHAQTVPDAHVDSPQGTQTVRHLGANGPLFHQEPLVPPRAPLTRADGLRRTGGRSARYGRTVWPTAADSPSSLFLFSLDIFRDKYLNTNLLGSLLMNHEGNLPHDAM